VSWPDVMQARADADTARMGAEALGGRIEDAGGDDLGLAILLAGLAVCAEIRALTTLLDARADS
jgi:hypothetical protein